MIGDPRLPPMWGASRSEEMQQEVRGRATCNPGARHTKVASFNSRDVLAATGRSFSLSSSWSLTLATGLSVSQTLTAKLIRAEEVSRIEKV